MIDYTIRLMDEEKGSTGVYPIPQEKLANNSKGKKGRNEYACTPTLWREMEGGKKDCPEAKQLEKFDKTTRP